jgi:arsenate reductase (thioredoxin)
MSGSRVGALRATAIINATIVSVFGLVLACSTQQMERQHAQVLFICEHGNVKSLMAASYFNRLAQERGLPYRAVPRGTAPNATTVPPAIIANLRKDGIDVSSFHPSGLSNSDLDRSARVITIGVELPKEAQSLVRTRLEKWNDVPAATIDYSEANKSLKAHLAKLVDELAKERRGTKENN